MEVFLYLLIALLVVSFAVEKFFTTEGQKKQGDGDGILPDLATALRDEKTRKAFASRLSSSTAMSAPRKKRQITEQSGWGGPEIQIPDQVKDTVAKPAGIGGGETRERIEICVNVEEISGPDLVEQGQKNCIVKLSLVNTLPLPLDLASVQLKFDSIHGNMSSEYTVRAQAGNPSALPPQRACEFWLAVETGYDATLGKVEISPEIFAQIEGESRPIQLKGDKVFNWIVEPKGREFEVCTENDGNEVAGRPFSLMIQACRNRQRDFDYSGLRRIEFSLEGSPTITHAAEIPKWFEVEFDRGKAITSPSFCLCNTLECYSIKAVDRKAGGGEGISAPIELSPGALETFQLDISSPQTNGVPFQGEKTLTAMDCYGNVKVDFNGNVELLCNVDGELKGLSGEGHVVSGAMFHKGVAKLEGLTFRLIASASEDYGDGTIVQLIASADGKFGYSDDITMLPAPMNATETQAVIQRLLGVHKRKLWLINCEPKLAEMLGKNFRRKYELACMDLTPEEIADRFASSLPDVVFLEDGAPPRDGFQILQKICHNPVIEGVPVLFLGSPTVSENKIGEILRTGSVYLTKPPNIPAIRAMVSDLLDKRSTGRGRLPNKGARLPGSDGTNYQIIAKIGEGGMGYIYEAKRMRDQQRIIIKYLPPKDLQNIKSIVRFVQEAHAVLSFQHEHLVCGYDLFMDRNRCFYVMEFIEGETLEQYLHSAGKVEPAQATRIILQVARALQALEGYQLVHRDIKPANILITPEGLVKLVDFGIAKVTNHKLTTMGIILGTPYYLSPEQIQGGNISILSDIYSLGATFYHIVTGEVPFQGTDVYSIIHQRLRQHNLKDPREYNPAIPRAIADIIMKMMQLKAKRRYASPAELIANLEHVLQVIDSGALALEEEEAWEDETSEDQNLPLN